ncbi:acetoin utilization protein AcuC [Cohnella caldifontis]|uniref:acetoin utilization protein AcuC n=1 Tax=Cohnella caldifontis TaxID=3027471 RepID=UPI0023EDDC3A|nr:acetoin utilization protein AcuC [Cohnella sp. YIM B05605]
MKSRTVWVDSSAAGRYRFHDEHPFHPIRLSLTEQLLRLSGALDASQTIDSLPATEAERSVRALHRPDYVAAVLALSAERPAPEAVRKAETYGLHPDGDTPYFAGMHEAAVSIVAGSLAAADAVMSGFASRALHLAGGLHHAFPERAAGFCVYNDAAAAISRIREAYGSRVLYVDTDVHHGDGVQWFFYTDPDVFTFSIHETGKYLFPGTGFAHERGASSGYGACLNLSMEPYTEDDSWLECFETALEKAASVFRPDVVVSQHGCDAHAFDPLAHVHCSMRIYREMPRMIRSVADRYADGRWIALGGGGYDHYRVAPRAWGLLWLEMNGHPLLEAIDAFPCGPALPSGWPLPGTGAVPPEMPATWLDDTSRWAPMPRRSEIAANNRKMLELALQHLG